VSQGSTDSVASGDYDDGISTAVTRLREKQRGDRAGLDALLDATHVGHFGLVRGGEPVVLPTAVVRDRDRVLLHGSTGSPWLRQLAAGAPTSLAVTALDAVIVARSAFESSLRYRSAVLFGRCTALSGPDKLRAMDLITDTLIPGRVAELRRPTDKELAATLVLALPIERWSLKVSDGWPEDEPGDVAGDAWAGVVPLVPRYGGPVPAPDLRAGIPVPASVARLAGAPVSAAR
jgi:nitroimidazol reductase NimA-like FMN-containing flavoprotein (pyridoxamine 5'-phosphate oxidase superfamily)